jgi:hypothetical protein
MVTLSISENPIYPAYKALENTEFKYRLYLSWSVEPEPADAGVDLQIAEILADSWHRYKVLFLGGPVAPQSSGTWHQVSKDTFVVSLGGKISNICISSDRLTVQTLFDQPGFDWSQRGQMGLLLSPDVNLLELVPRQIARDLADEQFDEIRGARGYCRPGDDGDFAELGFASNQLLAEWFDDLTEAARRADVAVSRL